MPQRLPRALAQIKAGNNSQSLLYEVRQIVYSLYHSKKLLKKYTRTKLNQYNYKNVYYIYEL